MTTEPHEAVAALDGAALDYRITQISLVVRDLRRTMEQYHRLLRWGPWNVFEHTPRRTTTPRSTASRCTTPCSAPRRTSAARSPG